ncbi:MAG: efflux RND transporter periplasmic adaptor subunit [Granulosicoccus sp.]
MSDTRYVPYLVWKILALHSHLSVNCFLRNAGLSCVAFLVLLTQAHAEENAELDCVIYPSVVSDLGSSATGLLSELLVDRGDLVSKGDTVAVLESGAERAAVKLAKLRANSTTDVSLQQISIAFAERREQRSHELIEPQLISESSIDEQKTETRIGQFQLQRAQENLAIAKIELQRSEEILARRTIRSPFDGVVMEKYKSVGEMVEDKPVVRVAKLNPLNIEVIVPASKISTMKRGLQAEVWVAGLEGSVWTAFISRVDPVADVASDTYGVLLELPNPDYEVPVGRRCLVRFLDTKAPIEISAEVDPTEAEAAKAVSMSSDFTQAPDLASAIETNKEDSIGKNSLSNKIEASSKKLCQWSGPYKQSGIAKEMQNQLRKDGFAANLVERSSTKRRGTVVKSVRQASRQDAVQLLDKLHKLGYVEARLSKAPTAQEISLGAFEDADNAAALRESLSADGVDVELLPWNRKITNYYLAVHSSAIARLLEISERPPTLISNISLRNKDGTFRNEACDSFLTQ